MTSTTDMRWMQRALTLAQKGMGHVEPNPPVGCVLLDASGVLVAEGYHATFGEHHAEAAALNSMRAAGANVKGGTAYVTLEPCAHIGKTPPCADALIGAQLARVVIAAKDPFSKVAGKGIAKLIKAGIDVHVGTCQHDAERQQRAFRLRHTQQRPEVLLKWAQTLDGALATSTGDSQWISNKASRQHVHQWRSTCDAIVVGIGTFLADKPQLTVRGITDPGRRPLPVVIDEHLRYPLQSHWTRGVIVTSQQRVDSPKAVQLRAEGLQVIAVDMHPLGGLDLRAAFALLLDAKDAQRGAASRIWVEGGGALLGSALRQKVGDRAIVYIAPQLIADKQAIRIDDKYKVRTMQDSYRLKSPVVTQCDGDIWLDADL